MDWFRRQNRGISNRTSEQRSEQWGVVRNVKIAIGAVPVRPLAESVPRQRHAVAGVSVLESHNWRQPKARLQSGNGSW